MSPTVWISTTNPEITFDSENPGDHWQRGGEIDTTEEGKFWKSAKSGSSKVTEFYLLGDPDSAWVQAPKPDPFWIAINPYSAGVVYSEGSRRQYLVSTEKAVVTKSMGRRAPEPHPGRLGRVCLV